MDQDPEDACGSPAPVPLYWGSDQHWPPVPTGPGLDRKGARGRRGLSLGTGSFAFSRVPRSSGGLPAPPLTEAAGQGGARHSLPGGRRQASLSCLHALPRRFFLRGLNEINCAEL